MDSESATGLVECIGRIFSPEPAYFWLPWGSNNAAYEDQVLYSGVIEDLRGFPVEEQWHLTPEYCWPQSRSWCISTDRDCLYSLLGGSTALISAVLTHPLLDAISVEPSTSLTGFEARPN